MIVTRRGKEMYDRLRDILLARERGEKKDDISIQQKHNAASVDCLPSDTTYITVHEEKKKKKEKT